MLIKINILYLFFDQHNAFSLKSRVSDIFYIYHMQVENFSPENRKKGLLIFNNAQRLMKQNDGNPNGHGLCLLINFWANRLLKI